MQNTVDSILDHCVLVLSTVDDIIGPVCGSALYNRQHIGPVCVSAIYRI